MGIGGKFLGQTSAKFGGNVSSGGKKSGTSGKGTPSGKFLGQTKGKPAVAGARKAK